MDASKVQEQNDMLEVVEEPKAETETIPSSPSPIKAPDEATRPSPELITSTEDEGEGYMQAVQLELFLRTVVFMSASNRLLFVQLLSY